MINQLTNQYLIVRSSKPVANILMVAYFFGSYSLIFFSRGLEVPDRVNYTIFFSDPESSRFEPLFVMWGNLLKYLSLSPEFALYVTALSALALALSVIYKVFLDNLYRFFVGNLMLFAIFPILTFVQFRAALAIWLATLALICANFGRRKMPLVYLSLIVAACFIHYSVIPFAFVSGYYFLFRKVGVIELLGAFVLIALISVWVLDIAIWLGLSEYYSGYFYEYRNDLTLSPFMIFYFLILVFLSIFNFMTCSRNLPLRDMMYFSCLSVPVMIYSYFSGYDLFVKAVMPFVIILYLIFFGAVNRFFEDVAGRVLLGAISGLAPIVLLYPYFKY